MAPIAYTPSIPWITDDEDDEQAPVEALTLTALGGWWTASAELDDLD